jgi:hypothetical protein
MKLVLLTLVLCGAAFAAPRSNFLEDDQLVPEEELSWNDAEASVAELMQAAADPKSGKDQCYQLADSTEADVKANVKAQQDLIDDMDNGSECPKAGDAVKNEAQGNLNNAQAAYDSAKASYEAARDKKIDMGTHTWSSLSRSSCAGTFFDSGPWADQKLIVDNLKAEMDSKAGSLEQAKKAKVKADSDAAHLVNQCKCDIMKVHQDAIKKANDDMKDANEKAWTNAAHIRCVVAGKKTSNCDVSAVPKVEAAPLAAGTECISGASSHICDKKCMSSLLTFLKVGETKSKEWEECYDSDTDSDTKTAREKCNSPKDSSYKKMQLAILKRGNYIYGSWSPPCYGSGWENYSPPSRARLFTNQGDTSNKNWIEFVGGIKGTHGTHGQYCGHFLTFGGGHDLYTPTNWKSTNSYTNLGHGFGKSGYSYGTNKAKNALAGTYSFKPNKIEMFIHTQP